MKKAAAEFNAVKIACIAERDHVQDMAAKCCKKENNMEYKIIKVNRQQLYEEIWTDTLGRTAKKYNVPYSKLKEACLNADIPLPGNAYWGSVQLGIEDKIIKTPLPGSETEFVELPVRESDKIRRNTSESPEKALPQKVEEETAPEQISNVNELYPNDILTFLDDEERKEVLKTASTLKINESTGRLHKVLKAHKTAVEKWVKTARFDPLASRKHESYWKRPDEIPALCDSVSVESFDRIYRMLSVLFEAVEALGGKVNNDLSVNIRGEHVAFGFSESQKQVPHALTKEEKHKLEEYEREKLRYSYAYKPNIRKYDYLSTGKLTFIVAKKVRDTDNEPIEQRIDEMLILLYELSEQIRLKRIAAEEAERKRKEEERLKELRKEQYNEEVDKFELLKQKADDYDNACRIRSYANAILTKENITDEEREYAEWALNKADWLDPTIEREDELFGKREHGKKIEKIGYYGKWW